MPVRLACVKPAASVRSEPGSNSQVEGTQIIKPKPNHPNTPKRICVHDCIQRRISPSPSQETTIKLLTSPRPVKPQPRLSRRNKSQPAGIKTSTRHKDLSHRDQPKPVRKDKQSRNAAYVSLSLNNNAKQRTDNQEWTSKAPSPANPNQSLAQKQNPPTENPPTQNQGQPSPHQKMGKLRKLSATLQRRRR